MNIGLSVCHSVSLSLSIINSISVCVFYLQNLEPIVKTTMCSVVLESRTTIVWATVLTFPYLVSIHPAGQTPFNLLKMPVTALHNSYMLSTVQKYKRTPRLNLF